MNDNAFLLKIRGRLQLRGNRLTMEERCPEKPPATPKFSRTLGVFGDYRANRSDDFASQFNLRRARLLFLGHLLRSGLPRIFFRSGLKQPKTRRLLGSANLLDYYVLSTHLPLLNVQLGQYKVFFNRSQINNTASMQFAERAPVRDAFQQRAG